MLQYTVPASAPGSKKNKNSSNRKKKNNAKPKKQQAVADPDAVGENDGAGSAEGEDVSDELETVDLVCTICPPRFFFVTLPVRFFLFVFDNGRLIDRSSGRRVHRRSTTGPKRSAGSTRTRTIQDRTTPAQTAMPAQTAATHSRRRPHPIRRVRS